MNYGTELERVHSGEGGTVYAGSDGFRYILRKVDRDYDGRSKPPSHYLLRGAGKSKPRYISGLFPTAIPGVLSGDDKDELGVRCMFTLRVIDGGQAAVIESGRGKSTGSLNKGG